MKLRGAASPPLHWQSPIFLGQVMRYFSRLAVIAQTLRRGFAYWTDFLSQGKLGQRHKRLQLAHAGGADSSGLFLSASIAEGGTTGRARLADTRSMFVTEFDQWAHRSGAHRGEDFIIRNFLAPEKCTLEAGCGGGRLLIDLQARGFTDLHGFDFLSKFIDVARYCDVTGVDRVSRA